MLIFLVGGSVAGVWRGELVRLQVARVIIACGTRCGSVFGMILRGGVRFISWTRSITGCRIRCRSLVFASSFSGGYNASFEITGFGSSRDGRLALVGGSAQFGI